MPDMPVPKDLTVPTPSSSAAAVPSGATTCVASDDNSPENHMRWQRYYESLEQATEAARSEAARAKPSSSGTQRATNTPVPSSSAASAETEEGGGTHSRTSSANKIPSPPKYIPQPPADDTPMEH
eukprot:2440825-Amphidinium_carterae.1